MVTCAYQNGAKKGTHWFLLTYEDGDNPLARCFVAAAAVVVVVVVVVVVFTVCICR